MENNMVNVYFFGKKYSVPAELTIMTAMEYAGYTLKRGCGCRHGFCGACATIYRIKGQNELKTCLACQTKVEEGMYVASIPFFPTDKRTYFKILTSCKSILLDLFQFFPPFDRSKRSTIIKCFRTNLLHCIWESYDLQPSTIIKCTRTNLLHCIWKSYGL